MSAEAPFNRRLAIAIATAATSATIAVGVTAASLLGWFRPAAKPPDPEPAAEQLVPVTPTQPQAAFDEEVQVAEHRRDHDHDHDDDDEEDDD